MPGHPQVRRILRVNRVVGDLERAEAFYRNGLGFTRVSRAAGEPGLLGLQDATMTELVMRLGREEIALVQFDPPGPAYPPDSRSDDLWFQHLAIVVGDMAAAYRHLSAHSPQPISVTGPQLLPPRNGSITAFKFRDLDGHPLELIHFPPDQGRSVWHQGREAVFQGIDHSALAVSCTPNSLDFYRRLGFRVAARSSNYGPAQAQLDGLSNAHAEISSLRPSDSTGPGLELLGYLPPGRPALPESANARVTDWVTLLASGLPDTAPQLIRDPDGHLLLLVSKAQGATDPACGPLT